MTSLSYTCQLYFDFSGYTDMALGVGLMYNIILPRNFNSPYKATSIIDFWSRWHITLSNFITTYLYTPILRSMNAITFRNSLIAIFVAMLISGFWHGAGWTFILWGGMHGVALVVNHLWKKRKQKMPRWLGWFITFNFVNISFVFFRARTVHDAIKVLKGMLGFADFLPAGFTTQLHLADMFRSKFGKTLLSEIGGRNETMWGLLCALLFILLLKNSNELTERFKPSWQNLVFVILISFYAFLNMGKVSEFLYFQF
jgi:D-alanyl-lipoteichoic acid acyltransferase DltB (MBOAT superfamily)